MCNNFLQLNSDKTEILVIGSQQVAKHAYAGAIWNNDKHAGRKLGAWFDSNLNFKTHTTKLVNHVLIISQKSGPIYLLGAQRLFHMHSYYIIATVHTFTLQKLQRNCPKDVLVLTLTSKFPMSKSD